MSSVKCIRCGEKIASEDSVGHVSTCGDDIVDRLAKEFESQGFKLEEEAVEEQGADASESLFSAIFRVMGIAMTVVAGSMALGWAISYFIIVPLTAPKANLSAPTLREVKLPNYQRSDIVIPSALANVRVPDDRTLSHLPHTCKRGQKATARPEDMRFKCIATNTWQRVK